MPPPAAKVSACAPARANGGTLTNRRRARPLAEGAHEETARFLSVRGDATLEALRSRCRARQYGNASHPML
eukprot:6063641-Pyramimonas_sp.AAC.1